MHCYAENLHHICKTFILYFRHIATCSIYVSAPCQNSPVLSEGAMKAKLSWGGQMPTALVKVSQRKAIKKGLVALAFLLRRPIDFAEKLSILSMKAPRCYTEIVQSYYTRVVIES